MKSFFVAAPFSAHDKIFLSEISAAMVKKILEKGHNCTEKKEKITQFKSNLCKIEYIHFLQVFGKAEADNEEPSDFASPAPVSGYVA